MTNANVLAHEETTLLGGRVRLLQPLRGLRAGLDAVMVAAACPALPGQSVLDLGCGTGAAGLCVLARVAGAPLTGFDIQPELLDFAHRSAALNGWGEACSFIAGDVRDKTALRADCYDHAVCNPPYLEEGGWHESPDSLRARQLGGGAGEAVLRDWTDCLLRVLKPSGSVSIVFRADRADKLIQALGARFGGVDLLPLHPHEGEAAGRVVIRALKNRKTPATLHPGLVLHEADGRWSARAQAVLGEGAALFATAQDALSKRGGVHE